nr:hypothetical protein CFP56_18596 [Quercus suber]
MKGKAISSNKEYVNKLRRGETRERMSESAIRSREEDAKLQRSTKKVKENHSWAPPQSISPQSAQERTQSYKEKLLGEMLGAFEQAFSFGHSMDTEAESDDEFPELPIGEKAMKFSGSTKMRIRAPWSNAIIIKVFGKIMGYHFLHSRITSMWKPIGRMDCVDLGNEFFLIKYQAKEDHAKVLREGLWFVENYHYKISSLAKGGAEVEARISQDEGKQKLSEDAEDAFGPWVLVA